MTLLKKASYLYDISIKNYTQYDLENMNGSLVVVFIKDMGWLFGRFRYLIETCEYNFLPADSENDEKTITYTRRIDKYIFTEFANPTKIIYQTNNSCIIWSELDIFKKRPVGLDPVYDHGKLMPVKSSAYFRHLPSIQYICMENDPDMLIYFKEHKLVPK